MDAVHRAYTVDDYDVARASLYTVVVHLFDQGAVDAFIVNESCTGITLDWRWYGSDGKQAQQNRR